MKARNTAKWLKARKLRAKQFTTMICLETDCGHFWDASRTSNPCPRCGSRSVVPADNWNFGNFGCLKLGKVAS